MDQASLHRDGSSIIPGLHPARLPVNNFYPSHGPGRGGTSAGFEQRGGTQPVTDMALTGQIDQMMNMLSSTQQLLLTQQSTCNRLEDTVAKLSSDVFIIQEELSTNGGPKKKSS